MIKDKNGRTIMACSVVKDPNGEYWCVVYPSLSTSGYIHCRNGCSSIYWSPEQLEVV